MDHEKQRNHMSDQEKNWVKCSIILTKEPKPVPIKVRLLENDVKYLKFHASRRTKLFYKTGVD